MFFDATDFLFTRNLEAAYPAIRGELDSLPPEAFIPWPEAFLYGEGWNVFGLHAFGKSIDENCERCPETTRLVRAVPGMTTAGFSKLSPDTRIVPHHGYTKAVLRCHLGLIVPMGCGLRVEEETRHWEEGKCLVFDDTARHSAWNEGTESRVVLLVDFRRPTA